MLSHFFRYDDASSIERKADFMTKDLTTGRVPRTLIQFSLPLLLSTLLQQFYNIADSIIIGQFTGESGLAAIGAAYPITLFFVAIATGTSMGCSVVLSRLFGAGEHHRIHDASFTALLSFGIVGIIVSLAGVALSAPLMHLLNAPSTIFSDAKAYLMIYAIGVFAMLIYNAASGIFTGLGDSRTPLYLLLTSSLTNVILDYIVVRFFRWGVIGAAWATTVSQYLAAFLAVLILLRRANKTATGTSRTSFDRDILAEISRSAVPCIFQQSCVACTHTIIQGLLNTYDTSVIAGYEAASKLHNFFYMSLNTLGTAFSAFTAQCRGARKYRRIREGFRVTTIICLGCTLAVVALFQLIPGQLINLFIDGQNNPLVIEAGVNYLRIISPVYIPICFIVATGGLLRGAGRSTAFFLETMAEFFVRIVMCFVLTQALASYTGLMWAWYFGSSCGFLMCLCLTIHTYRKRIPL